MINRSVSGAAPNFLCFSGSTFEPHPTPWRRAGLVISPNLATLNGWQTTDEC